MQQGQRASGWAASALVLTASVAAVAKIAGVIVAPGSRGTLGQSAVVVVETASGALAYTLAALLVALVCGASFELSRARGASVLARGAIVTISGLVLALASPAVVERLGSVPSLALAIVTSLVAVSSGLASLRAPGTRAVGGLLALYGILGLLRVMAWETSSLALERGSQGLFDAARGLSTGAVGLHALGVLFAAAWIGSRSTWRGRILANLAIVISFVITWFAARGSDTPSSVEAILRAALPVSVAQPAPYLLTSISAFLVPGSILLVVAALLGPREAPALLAALCFILLSGGSFDVPLQALLATVASQWLLLAMSDALPRRAAQRFGVQQPTSEGAPPIS